MKVFPKFQPGQTVSANKGVGNPFHVFHGKGGFGVIHIKRQMPHRSHIADRLRLIQVNREPVTTRDSQNVQNFVRQGKTAHHAVTEVVVPGNDRLWPAADGEDLVKGKRLSPHIGQLRAFRKDNPKPARFGGGPHDFFKGIIPDIGQALWNRYGKGSRSD